MKTTLGTRQLVGGAFVLAGVLLMVDSCVRREAEAPAAPAGAVPPPAPPGGAALAPPPAKSP